MQIFLKLKKSSKTLILFFLILSSETSLLQSMPTRRPQGRTERRFHPYRRPRRDDDEKSKDKLSVLREQLKPTAEIIISSESPEKVIDAKKRLVRNLLSKGRKFKILGLNDIDTLINSNNKKVLITTMDVLNKVFQKGDDDIKIDLLKYVVQLLGYYDETIAEKARISLLLPILQSNQQPINIKINALRIIIDLFIQNPNNKHVKAILSYLVDRFIFNQILNTAIQTNYREVIGILTAIFTTPIENDLLERIRKNVLKKQGPIYNLFLTPLPELEGLAFKEILDKIISNYNLIDTNLSLFLSIVSSENQLAINRIEFLITEIFKSIKEIKQKYLENYKFWETLGFLSKNNIDLIANLINMRTHYEIDASSEKSIWDPNGGISFLIKTLNQINDENLTNQICNIIINNIQEIFKLPQFIKIKQAILSKNGPIYFLLQLKNNKVTFWVLKFFKDLLFNENISEQFMQLILERTLSIVSDDKEVREKVINVLFELLYKQNHTISKQILDIAIEDEEIQALSLDLLTKIAFGKLQFLKNKLFKKINNAFEIESVDPLIFSMQILTKLIKKNILFQMKKNKNILRKFLI